LETNNCSSAITVAAAVEISQILLGTYTSLPCFREVKNALTQALAAKLDAGRVASLAAIPKMPMDGPSPRLRHFGVPL
jgi:hypothetical protein